MSNKKHFVVCTLSNEVTEQLSEHHINIQENAMKSARHIHVYNFPRYREQSPQMTHAI